MVAHHEVAVFRDYRLRHGAGVAISLGHVELAQRVVVEPDLAMDDPDPVAGQPDDPLDVAFRRVARVAEDDDVAALNRLYVIDEFVDKEPVAVFQAGQHAGAFHPDRLIEKGDDQHRGDGGNKQIAEPEADGVRPWRRWRRRLPCGGRHGGGGIGEGGHCFVVLARPYLADSR